MDHDEFKKIGIFTGLLILALFVSYYWFFR